MTTAPTVGRCATACLLAAFIALLTMAPASRAASARLDRVERKVLHRFNAIRAHAGLRPLKASRRLARAADAHNRDMLSADFFDHASSNGQSMGARVAAFRPARMLGEILAYVPPGRRQSRTVVGAWMASPPHRSTIVTSRFRRVGIARRTGSLAGSRVTVYTADFASPR